MSTQTNGAGTEDWLQAIAHLTIHAYLPLEQSATGTSGADLTTLNVGVGDYVAAAES